MFHYLYFRAKKETPPPINIDSQEINSLKSKNVIEDGIMKFRDVKHLHEVNDLYHDDFASLEKVFGYTSYNSKINQVMDDFDLISSEAEFKIFMKENQNYITTRIRDGEKYYLPIVDPNTYTYIANEDGLYYIGDTAYRVIGEYILSTKINMVDKILKINYDDLIKNHNKNTDHKIKKYIEYYTIESEKNLKSQYFSNGLFEASATRSDGKRIVFLTARAYIYYGVWGTEYKARIEIEAGKKSWFFGWLRYPADLDVYGTDLTDSDVEVSTPWGRYLFF